MKQTFNVEYTYDNQDSFLTFCSRITEYVCGGYIGQWKYIFNLVAESSSIKIVNYVKYHKTTI